ncbi:MAG: peptide chain release factor N(5)-glutamine methyltransferase [Actinomycetota bacterium]|nr:peptide chain release factor N(5)-glutamine methyltransferase [Actinomycetota bacterium]
MAAARVGEALDAAIDALRAVGIDTPRLDAEVLLSGISGHSRADLVAWPELTLDPGQSRSFSEAVRRRLRREPVAYILGTKGFRYIDLHVDPRVLVPRPETEMLVELALEVKPGRVLEIGTGSGAIALAVADELPAARIVATDVSSDALAVARANAARLGLEGRVEFVAGSLPPGPAGFDLILANLPYVPAGDSLPPDVSQWEPEGALFGGPDGTDVIREVLDRLGREQITAPVIGLEIGQGQGEVVSEMTLAAGFATAEVRLDLAGIDRVVTGRRARPEKIGS